MTVCERKRGEGTTAKINTGKGGQKKTMLGQLTGAQIYMKPTNPGPFIPSNIKEKTPLLHFGPRWLHLHLSFLIIDC